MRRIQKAEKYYKDLPAHHREMIPDYPNHLQDLQTCIQHNYEIIKLIVSHTDHMFENKDHTSLKVGCLVVHISIIHLTGPFLAF